MNPNLPDVELLAPAGDFEKLEIEILRPVGPVIKDQILDIVDAHHQSMAFAQPGSKVTLKLSHFCSPNDLIRRVSTAN